MIPVVLSGGSGTRLWPVSRAKYPKQFCDLFEDSLQTLALQRLKNFGTSWVLTGVALKDFTESQARQKNIAIRPLYEPMAKNTAPALAFLLKVLEFENKLSEVVGLFPADQLIENTNNFNEALSEAIKTAEQNKIVTLGVKPTYAATGFGYIQTADKSLHASSRVLKFHEKPQLQMAEKFLAEGSFFWNAGIFVFKAESMKQAFCKYSPELWKIADELKSDLSNLKQVYEKFPSISIDYAIMEKLSSEELSCVPCDMGWSDVGSWDAVAEIYSRGRKNKSAVEIKASGNFIFSKKDKNYSFVGVDDLIVVDTEDALLVSKKGSSQDVKSVVDIYNQKHSSVTQAHVFEDRPWGHFEVLRDTKRFKSKVIQVHPGQQLSLQSHAKREEHWIITAGSGEVVLDDKIVPVRAGVYVHIPLGAKHRMRNTGKETLEFIEVQLGSYFGEDDIVRYQDDYGR